MADGAVYLDRVQVTSPGATVCEQNGLLFSPDSEHLVYVVELNSKQSVVVDGVPGKQYDEIGTIVFSPDSKHLAYAAKTGNNWFIVVDGTPGKTYDGISDIVFSPDSKHLAYVAGVGLGGLSPQGFVVMDGVEGKQYEIRHDINTAFNLAFSPDSNHLAYAVEGKPTYTVGAVGGVGYTGFVIVDSEGKYITDGTVRRLLFSPDSKRLAYVELLPYSSIVELRYFVVVDGKKGEKYEYIDDFVFSPDSKHVIYIVIHGRNMFVVVGQTEGKEYGYPDFAIMASSAEELGIKRIVFDSADRFHYLVEEGDGIYLVEETLKQD
jgi:WD40 repeat protein